jgi:acyl-CoA synthetase (AMP-forming)/AMP-acid ligase II
MHGAAQWTALAAILAGNKVVLSGMRRFDPDEVWRIVEREKVNTLGVVGDAMARPLIERLADEPGRDVSSLVVFASGGAILSPAVKEAIAARLPNVLVIDSIGA